METLRHLNEYRKSNKYCDICVVVGKFAEWYFI